MLKTVVGLMVVTESMTPPLLYLPPSRWSPPRPGMALAVRTCVKLLVDQRAYTLSFELKLWSTRSITLLKLKSATLSAQKKLFCHAGEPAETVLGNGYSARILAATGLIWSAGMMLPVNGWRIHLPLASARP